MLSAFGTLLPIALAVAVSSVPITLTILILLSPKRNRLAIPFLIGWVVGMAVVVVVSALRGQRPPDQVDSHVSEGDRHRRDHRRGWSSHHCPPCVAPGGERVRSPSEQVA